VRSLRPHNVISGNCDEGGGLATWKNIRRSVLKRAGALRGDVAIIQAARPFSERMKRINIFTSASVSF
jgi:hypothetical protein